MTPAAFRAAPRLALDTEFVWNRTYHARLGLVQAFPSGPFDRARLDPGPAGSFPPPRQDPALAGALLIDPFRASPAPLGAVLSDASCVKLLHDASQDLTLLARWTGARPRGAFDTRVAAGFCGLPSTLSLAALVKETTGIELPKTETRTDWCARPLSPRQLEYAAQDVAFLDAAAEELLRRAEAAGTAAWMFEEMERLDNPALYDEPPLSDAWRRVKFPRGVLPPGPGPRRRLRALAVWRERLARERDLPRRWVAADEALVSAAARTPASPSDLPPRSLSPKLFPSLLDALREEEARAPQPDDEADGRPPRDPAEMRRIRDRATGLLAKTASLAQAARVDPALVASRSEMESWLLSPDDPSHALNRGWRRKVAGAVLRALL